MTREGAGVTYICSGTIMCRWCLWWKIYIMIYIMMDLHHNNQFQHYSSINTLPLTSVSRGHAPIPHVTTKTYALVRSRLSRAAEKPHQNSKDVKECEWQLHKPISSDARRSNRKKNGLPSNQRAGGGVDQFHCPRCVYFRQYLRHGGRERQRTGHRSGDTRIRGDRKGLFVHFVEFHRWIMFVILFFTVFLWWLCALERLTACLFSYLSLFFSSTRQNSLFCYSVCAVFTHSYCHFSSPSSVLLECFWSSVSFGMSYCSNGLSTDNNNSDSGLLCGLCWLSEM